MTQKYCLKNGIRRDSKLQLSMDNYTGNFKQDGGSRKDDFVVTIVKPISPIMNNLGNYKTYYLILHPTLCVSNTLQVKLFAGSYTKASLILTSLLAPRHNFKPTKVVDKESGRKC